MTATPPEPPGDPQQVRPQPTPFTWNWGDIRDATQRIVGQTVIFQTVTGPVWLFFGTDEFAAFVNQAEERLAQCRSGLIRATELPQGLQPPGQSGNGQR